MMFDGKKICDEILADLKNKIADLPTKPALAVIWIGDDPVSAKYIKIKHKVAQDLGIDFKLIKLPSSINYSNILQNIRIVCKSKVDGVMIQLPLPKKIDRQKIIEAIPADKDVDGLRFCAGLDSSFQPPVVLAILRALDGIDLKSKTIAIVGHGFLVGAPLAKILKYQVAKLTLADIETADIAQITRNAEVVISATGQPGLIKTDMINKGTILIDAGTTEVGGELLGDVDPKSYEKSAFYTPVPGGIGPLTVAMLYRNLIK